MKAPTHVYIGRGLGAVAGVAIGVGTEFNVLWTAFAYGLVLMVIGSLVGGWLGRRMYLYRARKRISAGLGQGS